MLLVLFYFIRCDSLTFENKENLTQSMVKEEMNGKENINDIIIKNISVIGFQAFYRCSSLISISFQEPLILTTIKGSAFSDCKKLKSISIPSSVQIINIGAFQNCSSLISVSFQEPSNLNAIYGGVFYECSKLKSLTILSNISKMFKFNKHIISRTIKFNKNWRTIIFKLF